MRVVALLPAAAVGAGVVVGFVVSWPRAFAWALCLSAVTAGVAWVWRRDAVATTALAVGFASAGPVLALHAQNAALHPKLRVVLHEAIGGVALDTLGPPGRHDPVPTRALILEDAAPRDGFVSGSRRGWAPRTVFPAVIDVPSPKDRTSARAGPPLRMGPAFS